MPLLRKKPQSQPLTTSEASYEHLFDEVDQGGSKFGCEQAFYSPSGQLLHVGYFTHEGVMQVAKRLPAKTALAILNPVGLRAPEEYIEPEVLALKCHYVVAVTGAFSVVDGTPGTGLPRQAAIGWLTAVR